MLDAPGPNSGSVHNQSMSLTPLSYPMYVDLRRAAEAFEGVLAHWRASAWATRVRPSKPKPTSCRGEFFDVLGIPPALGRVFGPDDDKNPGAHPLVVLGHGFWQRRFGSDPKIIGGTVSINGRPMTVIGVARAGFHGIEVGSASDLYVLRPCRKPYAPTGAARSLARGA